MARYLRPLLPLLLILPLILGFSSPAWSSPDNAAELVQPSGQVLLALEPESIEFSTDLVQVDPDPDPVLLELTIWQAVFLTFLTVFVAEMGDKTQMATMLMSAQSKSPWVIFWGSASALIAASLVSVLLGEGVAQIIPTQMLQRGAAVGFIGIGLYVLWSQWHERRESTVIKDEEFGDLSDHG
ncbi:MAG: TMEM165/GDT1 family protein [Synechococcaceae cyanobacterium SM2_3_1]|nr:TMEM165/GDT1 family protein [Synechococcaceae cyanobacterium SM2_3_1]